MPLAIAALAAVMIDIAELIASDEQRDLLRLGSYRGMPITAAGGRQPRGTTEALGSLGYSGTMNSIQPADFSAAVITTYLPAEYRESKDACSLGRGL